MTKKHLVIVSMAALAMLLLVGCAAGTNPTVDLLDADGKSAVVYRESSCVGQLVLIE